MKIPENTCTTDVRNEVNRIVYVRYANVPEGSDECDIHTNFL